MTALYAALALVLLPRGAFADDAVLSPEQLYARAVEHMKALPQPPNATYAVDIHVDGAGFLLDRKPDGRAEIGFVVGDRNAKPDGSFQAAYRSSDGLTALQTKPGQWADTTDPLFDPTWSGISDWIRYGLHGRPATATPMPSPTPAAQATAVPEIAAVTAFGVAYYDVYDRGVKSCANGDPGHAVHLIAHRDPADHPLTDATIDLSTGELCALSFAVRQAGPVSLRASIDLDLGTVNDQPVVTHESFVITVHVLAFAVKQIKAIATYHNFAFPQSLDPSLFQSK